MRLYCDWCIDQPIATDVTDQLNVNLELKSGESKIASIDVLSYFDSHFTGTGLSSSVTGCDAIYFYAYEDEDLTTPLDDSYVVMTPADEITPTTYAGTITP